MMTAWMTRLRFPKWAVIFLFVTASRTVEACAIPHPVSTVTSFPRHDPVLTTPPSSTEEINALVFPSHTFMVILKYTNNLSFTFNFFVIQVSSGIYNYFIINTCVFITLPRNPQYFYFCGDGYCSIM